MLGALRERFPRPAVVRFYCYSAAASATFTVPIYVLFFRRRGLSLAEFGLLEAAYTVTLIALEFPTGYVADRIGRRNSLLLAATLGAAGAGVYMIAHSFAVFLAGMVLRAVGAVFRSGAKEAWLYDVLGEDDETDRFATVSGRARAIGLATRAGAALVGAAVYAVDPMAPWVLDVAALWVAAAVLLTLPAPTGELDREDRPSPREALAAARTTLARPGLRGFVAYTAVLSSALTVLTLFTQPIAVDLAGLAPATLGAVYAGLTLTAAGAASLSGRVEATLGAGRWFRIAPVAVAALALATLLAPPVALALVVLADGLSAVSGPLANGRVNDATGSAERATVMSGYSTVRAAVRVPTKLAAGAVATASLVWMVAGVGVATLVACGSVVVLGAPFDGRADGERTEPKTIAE